MIYLPLAVLPGLLLAPLGCWPKGKAAIDKVALLWEVNLPPSQPTLSLLFPSASELRFRVGKKLKTSFGFVESPLAHASVALFLRLCRVSLICFAA